MMMFTTDSCAVSTVPAIQGFSVDSTPTTCIIQLLLAMPDNPVYTMLYALCTAPSLAYNVFY